VQTKAVLPMRRDLRVYLRTLLLQAMAATAKASCHQWEGGCERCS
jgi:hypothetical protein